MSTEPRAQALQRALANPERLAALAESGLLDKPAHATLERYCRVVTKALGVPIGLVSLVDDHRQFFAGAVGLAGGLRETPLSHSFCKHVVEDGALLVVEDARRHPRVAGNGAVVDLNVVAYAGQPIVTPEGHVLGSFCAIDGEPRRWSERELEILADLAESVGAEIELMRRAERAERSEQELASINEELEAQLAQQGSATQTAAHDLRTPLSVLTFGVTHLLSHDASRSYPELARLIATMKRNVAHATSLVASMQDITRLAGDLGAVGPVDACQVAAEVCEDLLAGADGLAIDCLSPEQAVQVWANATDLRRCFENLIGNAKRFAAGHIRVEVAALDDEVVMAVEDDGPGLPDSAAYRQVWERNVRFHADTGRSGSGLGLAVVREMIERHGGRVWAQASRRLGGARFVIALSQHRAPRDPA